MHRFFSPQSNLNASQVTIIDLSEIHHIRDVLRLKTGDPITIFDGSGKEATGTISSSKDNAVTVTILDRRDCRPARDVRLILACAIPKKTKFESIIEKCTELGVDEIIPLCTTRTEFRKGGDPEKKTQRYTAVAINAAKQSKRSVIPKIHPVTDFTQALAQISSQTIGFIPCLIQNTTGLMDAFKIPKATKNVIFFIGPEGDFTPDEIQLAIKTGCIPVSLGPTVLKVDTAAICVLAVANLLLSAAHHPNRSP